MMRGILISLVMTVMVSVGGCATVPLSIVPSAKEIPPEKYCEVHSDCVPNKCCHPTDLINKEYAPNCKKDIFCSIAIDDSTKLDIKEWKPLCNNNIYGVRYEK